MDGYHAVSVVRTGGGKTTYFPGLMVLSQGLTPDSHDLKQSLDHKIPEDAICIIFRNERLNFNTLGTPLLAINEYTLKAARTKRGDLWTPSLALPSSFARAAHIQTIHHRSSQSRLISMKFI
ncbi:hypothetical protein BDP27DRAFT_1427268 [Rhodocollybia butyracea]|uniref:Uncharacterized protein n=1 Tax=Rhodocollybia butyracea TaxID=206335 RepID=A0A9P5U250_9AGAR|nr:hypothetical protein BDP27DRAFT_1427268 [Rhodocollybia butyracea]